MADKVIEVLFTQTYTISGGKPDNFIVSGSDSTDEKIFEIVVWTGEASTDCEVYLFNEDGTYDTDKVLIFPVLSANTKENTVTITFYKDSLAANLSINGEEPYYFAFLREQEIDSLDYGFPASTALEIEESRVYAEMPPAFYSVAAISAALLLLSGGAFVFSARK
jgi:hypothetical protein